MAIAKPIKPTVTMPTTFGGTKTEFSLSKVQNGYLEGTPDILAGDNLNFTLNTIGQNEQYIRIITDFIRDLPIGQTITVDENNNLIYKALESNSGRYVGEIIKSAFPLSNASLQALDGSLKSQVGAYSAFVTALREIAVTYPALLCPEAEYQAEITAKGQCGRFVLDDINRTIRFPKITRFIGGLADLSDLANTYQDQMQGHKHTISRGNQGNGGTQTNSYYPITGTSDNNAVQTTNIISDGTNGTPRVGSETYPTHTRYPYYIVVSNVRQSDPVTIDINKVMSDLALKADIDLNNTEPTQSFIDKVLDWLSPDYTAPVALSTASGFSYTAHTYGIIQFQGGNSVVYMRLENSAGNLIAGYTAGSGGSSGYIVPVLKGQTYYFVGTVGLRQFFPYKGAI